MWNPREKYILNATKALSFAAFAFFSLHSCNGYKYLELTAVNPGDLKQTLQSKGNNATDIRINGTITQADTDYLIELATSSDILTQLDLSNCDIKMPHHAFAGCTFIKTVYLPKLNMLSIPHHMFSGCTSLSNVKLPDECIIIEENAFKNCSSLTQITLPASIDIIKDGAFCGCSNLKFIYCEATIPPQCNSQCFADIPSDVCLYVPKGCVELYKKAIGWNKINNMIGVKESIFLSDTNWKKH